MTTGKEDKRALPHLEVCNSNGSETAYKDFDRQETLTVTVKQRYSLLHKVNTLQVELFNISNSANYLQQLLNDYDV